jgi:hypothetical protein
MEDIRENDAIPITIREDVMNGRCVMSGSSHRYESNILLDALAAVPPFVEESLEHSILLQLQQTSVEIIHQRTSLR